mgnify:CR=1 FL=1
MHENKNNILIVCTADFISSMYELKDYLNFNFEHSEGKNLENSLKNFDILIVQEEKINDITFKNLKDFKGISILIGKNKKSLYNFNYLISLPFRINNFIKVIDDLISKRKFSNNSTIKLKNYTLNKNERKLLKDDLSIILTEKEVQLLELFVHENKILSKKEILESVWKYSSETDTHTVETHIYRLRKKIKQIFSDDKFILNNENGYSI